MSDLHVSVAETGPPAAGTALRAILSTSAADLDHHLAAFMDSDAPEGAHKARVALRRLRTALTAFAPMLRRGEVRALRNEAKDIFRRLGAVRDADVHHEVAPGEVPEALRAALREKTRAAFRRREALTFAPRLLGKLEAEALLRRGAEGKRLAALPASELIGAALDSAYARLRGHGEALAEMDDDGRHAFRKDLKALRYLSDFLPEDTVPAAVETDLEALQDHLGLLNDLVTARARSGKPKTRRSKAERAALEEAEITWARLRKAAPWWGGSG